MEEECQSTVGKIISVPAGTVSAIASCTHQTSKDTAHKPLGSWELGAHRAVRLGAVGRGGTLRHDKHRRLGLVDGLREVPGADLAEAAVVGRGDEAVVPIVHLAPQDAHPVRSSSQHEMFKPMWCRLAWKPPKRCLVVPPPYFLTSVSFSTPCGSLPGKRTAHRSSSSPSLRHDEHRP